MLSGNIIDFPKYLSTCFLTVTYIRLTIFILHSGCPKINRDLYWHGHNSSEIHEKGKKFVCVFRKIQLICCSIGTKPFRISEEMAEKNDPEVGNPPLKMEKKSNAVRVANAVGGCQL